MELWLTLISNHSINNLEQRMKATQSSPLISLLILEAHGHGLTRVISTLIHIGLRMSVRSISSIWVGRSRLSAPRRLSISSMGSERLMAIYARIGWRYMILHKSSCVHLRRFCRSMTRMIRVGHILMVYWGCHRKMSQVDHFLFYICLIRIEIKEEIYFQF